MLFESIGVWKGEILVKMRMMLGCPIHLMLRFDDNSWARNMHDVFAIGYANSTSGTQYLLVMAGWNNHGRFVKYSYYGGIKGYKIWVRG